jgi:uncharacterized protein (TIGR02391 family)
MTWSGPVDPDALRTLPTSECAVLLLKTLAKGSELNSGNTLRTAQQAFQKNGERDLGLLLDRLSDAWAWLEAHALLGPNYNQTGNDWRRLTTRGRALAADPNAVAVILAEERLAMNLHRQLESKVRPIFALGDYETAAFAAMKAVEVRVRDLSAGSDSLVGVKLMRAAFKPEAGPLADAEADGGEQVATMELFAGAIGTIKNPVSHRSVDYEDPTEAAEAVLLADLLMRLLDRVEQRLAN